MSEHDDNWYADLERGLVVAMRSLSHVCHGVRSPHQSTPLVEFVVQYIYSMLLLGA